MIEKMNFSLLQGNELQTLSLRMLNIFNDVTTTSDSYGLYPFVDRVQNAYAIHGKALERESKNPFTSQLALQDELRNEAYVGLRDYAEACGHRANADLKAASVKIVEIFRKYGWTITKFGYKAKTAIIVHVMNDLKAKCFAEMEILSCKDWFTELDEAQEAFEQIQKMSINHMGIDEPIISDTRPQLIEAIKALQSTVEMQNAAKPTAELTIYEKALNELNILTMTTARAAATRQENEKKKESTSAETK